MIVRTGGCVAVEVVVMFMNKNLLTKDIRHPDSLSARIISVLHSGRETNNLFVPFLLHLHTTRKSWDE